VSLIGLRGGSILFVLIIRLKQPAVAWPGMLREKPRGRNCESEASVACRLTNKKARCPN
jgi:hypothetical protein